MGYQMCCITLGSARYFSIFSPSITFSLADECRIGEMILNCWICKTFFFHHWQRGAPCPGIKLEGKWPLCGYGQVYCVPLCIWISLVFSWHVISFDVTARNSWSTIINFSGNITFTYFICTDKKCHFWSKWILAAGTKRRKVPLLGE